MYDKELEGWNLDHAVLTETWVRNDSLVLSVGKELRCNAHSMIKFCTNFGALSTSDPKPKLAGYVIFIAISTIIRKFDIREARF